MVGKAFGSPSLLSPKIQNVQYDQLLKFELNQVEANEIDLKNLNNFAPKRIN